MRKFIDLTGQKFNRLEVIKLEKYIGGGKSIWLCLCDCGNKTIVVGSSLKNGHTRSCGCMKRENSITHRKSYSYVYQIWNNMIQRCTNIKNKEYKNYGGRYPKITICDRWNPKRGGSFKNFYEDMGDPPVGYEIDRINNDLGYYKANCRWVTQKEQARNRRSNKLYLFNNKEYCVTELSEIYKINKSTLLYRLNILNWSIEKALMTPINKKYSHKKEKINA
jgi:hypothetical protein